ncbi:MAG: AbrB/MazE/SpoVT family DNA-binding domain-containing protein [Actinomycetia bacterium]|nr:AbrB/MazE/SpoVT family DNA-binding domain-containing protein [Actinomycetes bacterium]
MLVSLKQNSQITIPKNIVDKLKLKNGDKLDLIVKNNEIKLRPVLVIDRSQAWYWSREWQDRIKEADKELASGRVKHAKDVDDLIQQLQK